MTWRVDPPRRFGTRLVAAISETRRHAVFDGAIIRATAHKQLLAVVVLDGDVTTLLDAKGKEITLSEFESHFPKAIEFIKKDQFDTSFPSAE